MQEPISADSYWLAPGWHLLWAAALHSTSARAWRCADLLKVREDGGLVVCLSWRRGQRLSARRLRLL